MARPIRTLLLGGSHIGNFIQADGQPIAEDPVNGFSAQLIAWLQANDSGRSYQFFQEGLSLREYARYLPGRSGTVWEDTVLAHLPIDLVVMDADNGASIRLNIANFLGQAQQDGDEYTNSAMQLCWALEREAQVNCIITSTPAVPTDIYTNPAHGVPNGEALQNKLADVLHSLPAILPDVVVPGPDYRDVLTPADTYYPLEVAATGGTERSGVFNIAGAAAAAAAMGAAIKAIPLYRLQPDQTGD